MNLLMLSAEAERLWRQRVGAACVSREFGTNRGPAPTIGSRKARRIARAAAAVSPRVASRLSGKRSPFSRPRGMKIFWPAPIFLLAACSTPIANPGHSPFFSPKPVNTQDTALVPLVSWTGIPAVAFPLHPIFINGHMACAVVELSVNGQNGRFVVDTGSTTSWFTPQFTQALKAKLSGQKINVRGAAGSRTQNTAVFEALDLQFARIRELWVISDSVLGDINRALVAHHEAPLSGLLGLDLLAPLGALVDLPELRIVFRKLSPPVGHFRLGPVAPSGPISPSVGTGRP